MEALVSEREIAQQFDKDLVPVLYSLERKIDCTSEVESTVCFKLPENFSQGPVHRLVLMLSFLPSYIYSKLYTCNIREV